MSKKTLWMLAIVFPLLLVIIAVIGWRLGTSHEAAPVVIDDTSAATLPAASAPLHIDLPATLAADLASSDSSVRSRAEALVATASYDQVPRLKQLADSVTDPRVAGLLHKRMDELEEQAASDPPPISLSVKDASASELQAALSKSLGKPFEFFPPVASADPLFTLDAQNQPFWNVINDLNHQHAIAIDRGILSNRQRGLVLRIDQPMPDLHPVHGFVVFTKPFGPPNILGAPPPAADELTLNYTIAADPRMWVTDLVFSSHDITVDGAPMSALKFYNGLIQFQAHDNLWSTAITVRMTDKFAGKTALVRAQHHFAVVAKTQTVVIEDMAKHVNETFHVGLDSLTLSSTSTFSATRISYVLVTGEQDTRADIDVFDAAGTLVQHNNYFKNNGATISGNFQPPFKLQITAPAKTTDVVVPVDLRFPLP